MTHGSYTVWAPYAERVFLVRTGHEAVPMTADAHGWFTAPGITPMPGERYGFQLDECTVAFPDPRSVSQPDGVHDLSEVVDLDTLARCPKWRGMDLRSKVIYELHLGSFTAGPNGAGGTCDSAIERLDELVRLGVDAIEIMPVAAFPGKRGWGYDGVGLFATHEAYGGPHALARLVTAAHDRGLGVVLDVVYNHLGPAGNYLGAYGPYFTTAHDTPWGPAVNFDNPGSHEVRRFVIDNARQWLVDFGCDGLRLDAVHALQDHSDTHILQELAEATEEWSRELGRPLTLIAESDLNDPHMVTPVSAGGMGMQAQWADDIHHHVHAWISGERQGYYVDFGAAKGVKKALESIFEHDGSFSTFRNKKWGSPVDRSGAHYDASAFVSFIQNHDQVGNRAAGDRLHHTISAEQHAAVAALYLLAPSTPMLFMGEEWAASSPFAFFSDHDAELGERVTEGRTQEFAQMGWQGPVPDPQDEATFRSCILDWSERTSGDHARTLAWYTRLLQLRREIEDLHAPTFDSLSVEVVSEDAVFMRRGSVGVLAARGGTTHVDIAVDPARVLAQQGKVSYRCDGISMSGAGALVFWLT